MTMSVYIMIDGDERIAVYESYLTSEGDINFPLGYFISVDLTGRGTLLGREVLVYALEESR